MYQVNCFGSMNLLWAALRAGVEKLVYTSSISAVGLRERTQVSDETVQFNKMGQANDYVYSKWITPTGQILLDIVNGKNKFYFDGGINVVDVEDVAKGHVLAEENGRIGERYGLGNVNVSFKDFFELTARVTGVRLRPLKMAVGLAVPLADYLEHRADTVTHKPPLFAGSALRYAKNYLYFDISKAKKELGYQPRPIEESIRRAVDWFAENGYIENEKFLTKYRRI
jgi:dihydroflavonol-4-reductase